MFHKIKNSKANNMKPKARTNNQALLASFNIVSQKFFYFLHLAFLQRVLQVLAAYIL